MRSTKSLAWRSLRAHPLRSALTALAISLGVAMVLAAAVVGQAANQSVAQLADHSQVPFNTRIVQAGLAMVGGIVLFAAAFVILNAFGIAVTGRTREIGALRALGTSRRQVLGLVLVEAGLLGLCGSALGVPLGLGLAWGVMGALGTLGQAAWTVPGWGLGLSLLLGLGVTLIGGLQPAWRASRLSPLAAIRSARPLARRRAGWYGRIGGRLGGALGLVSLPGVAVIALLLRPGFFGSAALLGGGGVGLLLATVLLLPALVRLGVALVRPLLPRGLGTVGRLAADNLGRNQGRTALTVGALTAALTAIIATSTLTTATFKGGLRGYRTLLHEDIMVTADIASLIASGELRMENISEQFTGTVLDPALVSALQARAESAPFEVELIGMAPVPDELGVWAGVPGAFVEPEIFLRIGNFDFFEGDVATALALMQRGRAVLLQPIAADRLGAEVGDTLWIETAQGEVPFTLAGVGGTGWNFPVFSYADGQAYFDLSGPSMLGVVVPPGGDVEAALAQTQQIVAPFEGVVAAKFDTTFNAMLEIVDQLKTLLNGLLVLAVLVAGLGVVNTMGVNVAERRREIALLRAVGATRAQVRRVILVEGAVLGLLAALIATGLSLAMLALWLLVFTPGGTASLGLRPSWELAELVLPPALRDLGLSAALSLIWGPVVAGLASDYPARQAARNSLLRK